MSSGLPFLLLFRILVWYGVTSFPISLIALPGSIVHEKLGDLRSVDKRECGLLCKYTPLCKGMIYNEVDKTCQLIQFDAYEFLDTPVPEETVYIRQWSFWNEPEFHFDFICPSEETRNSYMQRLATLELGNCVNDIPFYNYSSDNTTGRQPVYRDNYNKEALACNPSRKQCGSGCTKEQFLIVNTNGTRKIFDNTVTWDAVCYDGKWFYYSVETQQLYPVDKWRCTADIVFCLPRWFVKREECWFSGLHDYADQGQSYNWALINGFCKKENATIPKILNNDDWLLVLGLMRCNRAPINVMRNDNGLYALDGMEYSNDSFVAHKFKDDPKHKGDGYGYILKDADYISVGGYNKTYGYICFVCELKKTWPKEEPNDYATYKELQM